MVWLGVDLWVIHLVLISEAARQVTSFLRADSEVVQGCLLRCHAARIPVEGTQESLSTSVQGSGRGRVGVVMSDCNSSLLSSRKLLDKAVGRA